jgi:hypothetical protein
LSDACLRWYNGTARTGTHMRRTLILLSCTIILLVAAAHVYRDPRVQELFRTVPKAGATKKTVLPQLTPRRFGGEARANSPTPPAALEEKAVPARDHVAVAPHTNQTPNETVSRVLMQVLAAKGLARGISLEVSDESIAIFGEVDSDDKRQRIINVVEKGREGRHLDASRLIVQP